MLADTIDAHLLAYGEPDAARRTDLVAQVWADDGRLIDPPLDARGHDGIVEMADTVQQLYPGHTFARTTAVDEHHGVARYGWALRDPEGHVVLTGLDVAEVGDDGRLVRVVGFFGDLA